MAECRGCSYTAVTVGEDDVFAAVDSQAVVLVVNPGLVDGNAGGRADIESVSIMTAIGDVSIFVVDGNRVDHQILGIVDAEALDRGVFDVDSSDGGIDHLVGKEKLGLIAFVRSDQTMTVRCTLTFFLPPLPPKPSHQQAPLPSRRLPELPVTVILVPLTETRGPSHSLYPKVTSPAKITLVPLLSPVRSKVSPAGTARLPMVMVVQPDLTVERSLKLVSVHFADFPGLVGAAMTAANCRAAAMKAVVKRMMIVFPETKDFVQQRLRL